MPWLPFGCDLDGLPWNMHVATGTELNKIGEKEMLMWGKITSVLQSIGTENCRKDEETCRGRFSRLTHACSHMGYYDSLSDKFFIHGLVSVVFVSLGNCSHARTYTLFYAWAQSAVIKTSCRCLWSTQPLTAYSGLALTDFINSQKESCTDTFLSRIWNESSRSMHSYFLSIDPRRIFSYYIRGTALAGRIIAVLAAILNCMVVVFCKLGCWPAHAYCAMHGLMRALGRPASSSPSTSTSTHV